jgi:proteasome alpha subunit
VELLVAEVSEDAAELYHILYDGSIWDEEGFVAIGGSAEALNTRVGEGFSEGLTRDAALRLARESFSAVADEASPAGRLEVAGLDRTRGRRKFFRLSADDVAAALG